jgi:hypothetical protein
MGTGALFSGVKRPEPEVHYPHIYLKSTLGMSGAIYLLLLYALVAWTGIPLPLHLLGASSGYLNEKISSFKIYW